MKLSTELKDLPIVSIAEGEEVGVVRDFIVDPVAKAVVALVIADATWYAGAKVISFSLISSIGDYAITTENSSSVVELTNMPEIIDLLKKELNMIDAKVITRGGRYIGRVREYSINKESGHILGLELSSDSEIPAADRNVIPSSSIVTIGKDVIIVNDDVDSQLKSGHEELMDEGFSAPAPRRTVAPAAKPATPVLKPSAPKPDPVPVAAAPAPSHDDVDDIESLLADDFGDAPVEEPETQTEDLLDSDVEVDIEELLDLDSDAQSVGFSEEPATRAKEQPVMEESDGEGKESLSQIFERRQIKYMLGKKVSRDIQTDDGITIASQGDIISDDTITQAKAAGKFLELSMNIEID